MKKIIAIIVIVILLVLSVNNIYTPKHKVEHFKTITPNIPNACTPTYIDFFTDSVTTGDI